MVFFSSEYGVLSYGPDKKGNGQTEQYNNFICSPVWKNKHVLFSVMPSSSYKIASAKRFFDSRVRGLSFQAGLQWQACFCIPHRQYNVLVHFSVTDHMLIRLNVETLNCRKHGRYVLECGALKHYFSGNTQYVMLINNSILYCISNINRLSSIIYCFVLQKEFIYLFYGQTLCRTKTYSKIHVSQEVTQTN